jgi:hypothetical protein
MLDRLLRDFSEKKREHGQNGCPFWVWDMGHGADDPVCVKKQITVHLHPSNHVIQVERMSDDVAGDTRKGSLTSKHYAGVMVSGKLNCECF